MLRIEADGLTVVPCGRFDFTQVEVSETALDVGLGVLGIKSDCFVEILGG
jgi:hypothetical protein|tara:strand:- start:3107 stop:3256 length:150 start_codon:yes stop_codon:yes gene_type:complete